MTYHINILIHVSLCTSMRVSVTHKCWNGSDSAISSALLCCAVLHLVAQSCLILCNPMVCSLPGSSVHGILQTRSESVAMPSSRGSSQSRDRTQVSLIVGIFFITEPKGKPKNTGVVGLSLLQGIFPTQEWNQGLLHYRKILYQLSYPGSPWKTLEVTFLNVEKQSDF